MNVKYQCRNRQDKNIFHSFVSMIREFIQKETKAILAVALSASLILFVLGMQKWSFRFMDRESKQVLSSLDEADSTKNSIIEKVLADTTLEISTLKKQYLICGQIKSYYKKLGVSYYNNYYAFSICSIICITLLTIAVFLIANKGWQHSPLILKSFLLTMIVLSSIYYFLPNVLGNKDNLKNNMDKVKVFEKIQFDILALSGGLPHLDKIKTDSAITGFYNSISANVEFLTTIDNSTLNNEITDLLKNYKPGSTK